MRFWKSKKDFSIETDASRVITIDSPGEGFRVYGLEAHIYQFGEIKIIQMKTKERSIEINISMYWKSKRYVVDFKTSNPVSTNAGMARSGCRLEICGLSSVEDVSLPAPLFCSISPP